MTRNSYLNALRTVMILLLLFGVLTFFGGLAVYWSIQGQAYGYNPTDLNAPSAWIAFGGGALCLGIAAFFIWLHAESANSNAEALIAAIRGEEPATDASEPPATPVSEPAAE